MKTKAAILWGVNQDWQVTEIDLDPPKTGELLVKWEAAGMCHSDEHLVTGDIVMSDEKAEELGFPKTYPVIGGHEGAGIVLEVGPGVTSVEPGDHISASFVPCCGRCVFCSTGRSNICDRTADFFRPGQLSDGTARHHLNGQDINTLAKIGTYSELSVINEASAIKVDRDLPLKVVALVSCGVATGWGSAVYRAPVHPGDTVVVVGLGGVGMGAVQGARIAGARYIVAVDPIEFKQKAALDFGATHTAASMEEALPLVAELTWGKLAEVAIMTVGVLYGELLAEGLALVGKDGTCVATAVSPITQTTADINLFELGMYQKQLKGVIFGAGNPRFDVPNLLKLYRNGQLMLDEMVTRTYSLAQINEGFKDLREGSNIRGVIVAS